MADLLSLSARYIDENLFEGGRAVNPTDMQLSEVADGIALIAGFSHVVAVATDAGLVLFDTSLPVFAKGMIGSLRQWSQAPVHTVAYTHGHVDHVGGMQVFVEEAEDAGRARPRIIGHQNVAARFARYRMTLGYNAHINARQFSPTRGPLSADIVDIREPLRFGPRRWFEPDTVFTDRMGAKIGDMAIELHHAKGETADHLWAWLPDHKAVCTGDFVTWVFPNAGNPQKVQRYPLEWARALREMAAKQPELLLPAHGLPIAGRDRIAQVLDDLATALETIVEQCLILMNEGARLDTLIPAVRVPEERLQKPYMRAVYDEPEFVVRNVWRLYGGWYDGNPANLKPAPERVLAAELAQLAGGATVLAKRAADLAEAGEHRLACHLVEMAVLAAPDDRDAHAARAHVYTLRRQSELSLMARGIYGSAAEESEGKAD